MPYVSVSGTTCVNMNNGDRDRDSIKGGLVCIGMYGYVRVCIGLYGSVWILYGFV